MGMVQIDQQELDRLRAEVALATDTIQKCNAWIAEAKPLLEKGGNAGREVDSLRRQLGEAREDKERLKELLGDESKKIRWPYSDREVSIESVEDDCENCCYGLGTINVVRYAVAVEIADEYYVWWEDNADSERPDVQQLWGPFATKDEADAQRTALAARASQHSGEG